MLTSGPHCSCQVISGIFSRPDDEKKRTPIHPVIEEGPFKGPTGSEKIFGFAIGDHKLNVVQGGRSEIGRCGLKTAKGQENGEKILGDLVFLSPVIGISFRGHPGSISRRYEQ